MKLILCLVIMTILLRACSKAKAQVPDDNSNLTLLFRSYEMDCIAKIDTKELHKTYVKYNDSDSDNMELAMILENSEILVCLDKKVNGIDHL